jgi:hypothetical protein
MEEVNRRVYPTSSRSTAKNDLSGTSRVRHAVRLFFGTTRCLHGESTVPPRMSQRTYQPAARCRYVAWRDLSCVRLRAGVSSVRMKVSARGAARTARRRHRNILSRPSAASARWGVPATGQAEAGIVQKITDLFYSNDLVNHEDLPGILRKTQPPPLWPNHRLQASSPL